MSYVFQRTAFAHPPTRDDLSIDVTLGQVVGGPPTFVSFNEHKLRSHVAIFGGTRKGKSKFLEMLLRHFLCSRTAGFCLIDPHGDLCEEILGYVGTNWDDFWPARQRSLYYLNPSEKIFAFDPFLYRRPATGDQMLDEAKYRRWLCATVHRVSQVLLRKFGEFDFAGKPQLEKYLKSVLYACGVRLDAQGNHLPLAFAPILLNPEHPRYADVWDRVSPELPWGIRERLAKIAALRPERREDLIGSTENRLDVLLQSVLQDVFSGGAAPLDMGQIIETRGVALANLAETDDFSSDDANAIGGLLISQIINYARACPKAERQPFYVIIDEAHRFIGQDILDMLGQSSKWGLFFVLAFQDLSAVRKGEIDLLPKLLSQCNVKMTFQQQHKDDAEALAEAFFYPTLDFTKLTHQQQFHDHYDWIEVESVTTGTNWQRAKALAEAENWSEGTTRAEASGTSDERSTQRGINRSRTKSTTVTEGDTETEGRSEAVIDALTDSEGQTSGESVSTSAAVSRARATTESEQNSSATSQMSGTSSQEGSHHNTGQMMPAIPITSAGLYLSPGMSMSDGAMSSFGMSTATGQISGNARGLAVSDVEGEMRGQAVGQTRAETIGAARTRGSATGTNRQRSYARSRADGESLTEGESETAGESHGTSFVVTIGMNSSHGGSRTTTHTDTEGGSQSTGRTKIPLAQFSIENVDAGQLQMTVPDQIARGTALIMSLKKRQFVLTTSEREADLGDDWNRAFQLEVPHVPDTFDGFPPKFQAAVLDWIKTQIFQMHDCYVHVRESLANPRTEEAVLDAWIATASATPRLSVDPAAINAPDDELDDSQYFAI